MLQLSRACTVSGPIDRGTALSIAFTGPGSLSVDTLVGHYLSGTLWGAAALFIGILGEVMSLIQRRAVPTQQTAAGQ